MNLRQSEILRLGARGARQDNQPRATYVPYRTMIIVSDALCIIYLLLNASADLGYNDFWIWTIVGAGLLRLALAPRVDSLVFCLSIALIFLYFLPSLMLTTEHFMNATPFLALTILIFDFISFVSPIVTPRLRIPTSGTSKLQRSDFTKWLLLIIASTILGLVLPPDKYLEPFAHTVPFAVSLLYFERYIRSSSRIVVYCMLTAYALNIALYMLLYWSGYGRLIIGSMILMPLVIADRQIDIGVRLWQGALLAPTLLSLAYFSRYGNWATGSERYGGSAAHHLIITGEFFNSSAAQYYGGLRQFLEQWSLLILNWVPREFWADKPLGLGFTSVDEWFGRQGVSEGHSVSLGMYGEQLYLLGDNYLAGLAIVFASIVLLRCAIIGLSRNYFAPLAVFDVSLISYVWGGCGTFGSRAWFFILPMLVLIAIWKVFETPSTNRRRPINPRWRQVSSERNIAARRKSALDCKVSTGDGV